MNIHLDMIGWIFKKRARQQVYEQLQWQRYLLRNGIAASAQVLDLVEEKDPGYGYVYIRFWVVLKMKGSVTYRHIQAMIDKEKIPAIGDFIHIRYCPDDLSKVLVL